MATIPWLTAPALTPDSTVLLITLETLFPVGHFMGSELRVVQIRTMMGFLPDR